MAVIACCTVTPPNMYPLPGQAYLTLPRLIGPVDDVGAESSRGEVPTTLDGLETFDGDLGSVEAIVQIQQDGQDVRMFELDDVDSLVAAMTAAYETDSGPALTSLVFSPVILVNDDDTWWALPSPAETAAYRVPDAVQTALDNAERTLIAQWTTG